MNFKSGFTSRIAGNTASWGKRTGPGIQWAKKTGPGQKWAKKPGMGKVKAADVWWV